MKQYSGGIYKIECLPMKYIYIGQTNNFNDRIYHHKNSLKKNQHYNTFLQNAWNKYGEDNFTFEVIEKLPNNRKTLDKKETYWCNYYINLYGKKNIFNLASTGGGHNCSDIHRKHLSTSHMGIKYPPRSVEFRKILSESKKGDKNPAKRQDVRLKLSDQPYCKKVICIETGVIYKSIKDAAKHHNCSRSSISRCCHNIKNNNIADGYHWAFMFDKEYIRKLKKYKGRKQNKPFIHHEKVYCVELDKIFKNSEEAGRQCHLAASSIRLCCQGKRKTCGGYTWNYIIEEEIK